MGQTAIQADSYLVQEAEGKFRDKVYVCLYFRTSNSNVSYQYYNSAQDLLNGTRDCVPQSSTTIEP